jgi:hypothetical protein
VTAGSPAVVLDPLVTIIDGSATLSGGSVSVGLGFTAGDTLGYTAPLNNPVIGSYNPANGVSTLIGSGTVAEYQEALRAVTFATSSSTLASARTVSFVVTDLEGLPSISVPLAVTVLAINLPPVVITTVLNPIPYTAGNSAVALDPLVTIIDGSATLSGATAAITIGKTPGDELAFTAPADDSITGGYNSTTGVLTLTGWGTVAQYQEALRSVTFVTTTAPLASARTVSFVVTDVEGLPSISVPLVVTVALNLPPVVTTSLINAVLYSAGAAPKVLDPLVTIIDGSTHMSGATAAITIGKTTGDELAFTAPADGSITGGYNSTTRVLTLTGSGTVAQYQEALRSVTFESGPNLLLSVRTVAIVVTDQQGLSSVSLPLLVTVVGL